MKALTKMKSAIVLVIVVAFFILANTAGFSNGLKSFFYSVSAPMQKNLWAASGNISDFFSAFFVSQGLKQENDELNQKVLELRAQIADLESELIDATDLQSATDLGLEKEFSLIQAGIIGKDVNQDVIIIDKGSENGISLNSPVIYGDKILIGKISHVYEHYSKIMLLTNKDSSFDAVIAATTTYGIIKGNGNMSANFEFVPYEAVMNAGDIILTTTLGDIFPNGLLVGTVEEIEKTDTGSFQAARIKPAFDTSGLKNVFIIKYF